MVLEDGERVCLDCAWSGCLEVGRDVVELELAGDALDGDGLYCDDEDNCAEAEDCAGRVACLDILRNVASASSSSSSDDPTRVSSTVVELFFWLIPACIAESLFSRSSRLGLLIELGDAVTDFFLAKILNEGSEAFLYSFTIPAGAFLT